MAEPTETVLLGNTAITRAAELRAEADLIEYAAMLAALREHSGIESRAAVALGLSRDQFRNVLRRLPELAAVAREYREAIGYRTGDPKLVLGKVR